MEAQWPNLYIVGAAKSGTTSLYHYLQQHPEIFMSSYKEPHFFSRVNPDAHLRPFLPYISDEKEYLGYFKTAQHRIRGEASTSYLWEAETAGRIKAKCPDAKIIIMLREPVGRAYSHYLNNVRETYEKRSFREAILADLEATRKGWGISMMYVDLGYYCEQVNRYLNVFPGHVLVVFFEEFVRDIPAHMERVFQFLDVDPSVARNLEAEVFNPFSIPANVVTKKLLSTPAVRLLSRRIVPRALRVNLRHFLFKRTAKPEMDEGTRRLLEDIYKHEKSCLANLLRREVPWKTLEDDHVH
jgi:hypothetical protein